MKEIRVGENEAGQRLIRLLSKYLREAPDPFLYRMLRKKNIVLNGRKASGKEQTVSGDVITIYMSDETIAKFRGVDMSCHGMELPEIEDHRAQAFRKRIVYEDRNIIVIDKPAGMLSQRGTADDISLVDYLTDYMLAEGELEQQDLETFKPGIVSRLDRNTSGLVAAGKTLPGLQALNELVRRHQMIKRYIAVAEGSLEASVRLEGYWSKDEQSNTVRITEQKRSGAAKVITNLQPVSFFSRFGSEYSLIFVELETGKGHQIRAHLASIGHPLAGDVKYGGHAVQERRGQLLHASELVFPSAEQLPAALKEAAAARIQAELPEDMASFIGNVLH